MMQEHEVSSRTRRRSLAGEPGRRFGAARIGFSLFALLAMFGFPSAHAQDADVTVTEVRIPLPDGPDSHLIGDLHQLSGGGAPRPTVVTLSPFPKDTGIEFHFAQAAARAGMAALLVDMRGTGRSPGDFCFACEREITDGVEAVEWAAGQPFSDGNVGMFGFSTSAFVAALVAARNPPSLEALAAVSSYSDPYRDVLYPGGMPASEDMAASAAVFLGLPNFPGFSETPFVKQPNAVALEFALHDTYDDFWKERALENKVRDVTVPTLWVSGWDDIYVRGVPRNFLDMTAEHKALIMGPWGHFAHFLGSESDTPLDLYIRSAVEWLDIFLHEPATAEEEDDREQRIEDFPKVRLFDVDLTGDDGFAIWTGRWRAFGTWPPGHDDLVLKPCASEPELSAATPWPQRGSLVDSCETLAQIPVISAPIEATGPRSVTHDTDRMGLSDAPDQRLDLAALAFLGPEMDEPVTITGPAALELTAIATNVDADWVARIVDVGPEGARLVAQGRLRASHREEDPERGHLWHVHEEPEPLTPGETYELTIEIWPTSWVVAAGHRIGLLLQTADTAKTLPSRPAPANVLLVGPDVNTRLTLPIRTEDGETVSPP